MLDSNLNDHQRAYLEAIYAVDQDGEECERLAWSHGRRRRPADKWRWLEYAKGDVATALYSRLSMSDLVDQGTGSTFKARRACGLILLRYEPSLLGEPIPFVRQTTLARSYTPYHPGLLTDLYHPDSAYFAWRAGRTALTTFDLYALRAPFGGAYLLVAGLEIEFVRSFHYNPEDIAFLQQIRDYDPAFLGILERLALQWRDPGPARGLRLHFPMSQCCA